MQIQHQYKYNKLSTDATRHCTKKISDKISNKANADGKKIVENKEVVRRLFVSGRNSCFITLRNRKPHFLNNLKVKFPN